MELELIQSGSPGTVFRLLLDRTVADLEQASFVEEWLGPGQRLPVFDVQTLRDYGARRANRERLAELLNSYVRVSSGSVWERREGRWRRRRYSELNPLDLAELGDFGRLGDLTLFLAGVFPEHVSRNPLQPRHVSRLAAMLGRSPGEIVRGQEPVWLMEWLGRSAYEQAGASELAADFRSARRLLNVLTRRHLFPIRERWFPGPQGAN